MNQFLYRIQPMRSEMLTQGPTEQEAKVVTAHFTYLQQLVANGTVLLAGRTLNTDENSFGIVIFLAQTEADALGVMQNDPAVSQGVMKAELFPYQVALWSQTWPGK
jgi:uncharacterized protein YciI